MQWRWPQLDAVSFREQLFAGCLLALMQAVFCLLFLAVVFFLLKHG
jgi:hypothetical protein